MLSNGSSSQPHATIKLALDGSQDTLFRSVDRLVCCSHQLSTSQLAFQLQYDHETAVTATEGDKKAEKP
jgi:hypothetical protein